MIRNQYLASWRWQPCHENMPLAKDLLCPSQEEERKPHQKCLIQSPNSYFMDVRCPGCYKITNSFSHAQRVVLCAGCSTVLWPPTGGKAGLPGGCSFRQKQHWKYPVSERMGKHPNKHILDIKKKKKSKSPEIQAQTSRCSSSHPCALGIWR